MPLLDLAKPVKVGHGIEVRHESENSSRFPASGKGDGRKRRIGLLLGSARYCAVSVSYLVLFIATLVSVEIQWSGVSAIAQAAETTPGLPPEPTPIGPLKRAPNGQIEVVTPKTERSGHAICSKGAICVGKGGGYPTLAAALAAAREGDTVEVIGGTYRESVRIAVKNLTLRGVAGQPHIDCAGIRLVEDKSCLLLAGDNATLENLEISGAQISNELGANGACVRNEPNIGFTLRRVICHGSQDGVLSSGGKILIENSQFYDNGWDGQTHNVYFNGDCTVTVRGSVFRDARVGHEFKSRCRKTDISDSTFSSTKGSRNLDIPDGGETVVYRSTLTKGQGTDNSEVVGFAAESCTHPASMVLRDVRIVTSDPQSDIRNFDKCAGFPMILDHVTIEGPLKLIGMIERR